MNRNFHLILLTSKCEFYRRGSMSNFENTTARVLFSNNKLFSICIFIYCLSFNILNTITFKYVGPYIHKGTISLRHTWYCLRCSLYKYSKKCIYSSYYIFSFDMVAIRRFKIYKRFIWRICHYVSELIKVFLHKRFYL